MFTRNLDPKVIQAIPPALLKTLPAGEPPQGIQPNFADPPTQVPIILGVSIAFLVLAFFCYSIRIYTKLVISKNWNWADLTCGLGFMFGIVHFAAVVMGCINGPIGRHIWDIHLDKVLNKSDLYQNYLTSVMATPALGLIKSSLFIQYYLLFRLLRWVRISVWIGVTISAAFYIPVTILAFVLNSPWPGESFLDDTLSLHRHKFDILNIPTGVIGMLLDWYLLILPVPAVLALQMSTTKKLGATIVFMTGGLAAIASTANLYYRTHLEDNLRDSTWNVGCVDLWAQIEMFAGVAASSMPTVKLFFTRQDFSLGSWRLSLKSSVTHLVGSLARVKLPDYNLAGWGGSITHTFDNRKGSRMTDLESDGRERKAARASPMGDSQIHLTDVSATQQQRNDAS